MIEITASTVLLGIDGTLSPYSYSQDVLLPFAVENARSYLERCWDAVDTLTVCDLMARDAGFESSYDWLNVAETRREDMIDAVMAEVERLTRENSQSRGLKELQGFIFAEAYATGRLRSQVFEDVPQALACWKAARILAAVFSSRLSTAQREFFGHTEYGSLNDYLAGFFDTSGGSLQEPSSYRRIAKLLSCKEMDVVFVSDCISELDAACLAGMQTLTLERPGNAEKKEHKHPVAQSFYDVRILQQEKTASKLDD